MFPTECLLSWSVLCLFSRQATLNLTGQIVSEFYALAYKKATVSRMERLHFLQKGDRLHV